MDLFCSHRKPKNRCPPPSAHRRHASNILHRRNSFRCFSNGKLNTTIVDPVKNGGGDHRTKNRFVNGAEKATMGKERNGSMTKVHGAANGGEGGKNASKNNKGKDTDVNEVEGEREGNGGDITKVKNGVGHFPIPTINIRPEVVGQLVAFLIMWYKKRKPSIIGLVEERVIIYSRSDNKIKMKLMMDGVEDKYDVFVEVTPRHLFVTKAYNREEKLEHHYVIPMLKVDDGNFRNASYLWKVRSGWLYVTVTDLKKNTEIRYVNKQAGPTHGWFRWFDRARPDNPEGP